MFRSDSSSQLNQRLVRSSALTAAILGAATLLAPVTAMALPQGGVVQGGAVTIGAPAGNKLTIDQTSQRGAINWNSFDVGRSETVRFNQPNANAITLNRVDAATAPSQIFGTVSSNGKLVVSNPNGVVFGAGSFTDVAGLIATTAKIDSGAFMNATNKFDFSQKGAANGSIKVEKGAQIDAKEGGLVALVAPEVTNEGLIVANQGKVTLAGSEVASFDVYGDGLVNFATASGDGRVAQNGVINAHGGQVLLTAKDTRNLVDAVVSPSGIREAAALNGGVLLGKNSQVDVNGVNGKAAGTVRVNAENIAADDGARIDASVVPYSATATAPAAGNVVLTADHLSLPAQSTIKAIGGKGGNVELNAKDMLLAGNVDTRGGAGGKGKIVVNTQGDVRINDGEQNGQLGHLGETWIERASNRGNDLTVNTNGNISMANLSDNVLAGGNGNITLNATSQRSGISLDSAATDRIQTTGGNIAMKAGLGGIKVGDIRTGVADFTGFTKGQTTGDVKAGSVNLKTVNGGDIAFRDIRSKGTTGVTTVSVYADGNLNGRSVGVELQDLPDPGTNGQAKIDLQADDSMTISKDLFASSVDAQGQNANTVATIRAAAENDLTIGGTVRARSEAGLPGNTNNIGSATSNILISGQNVDLHQVQAQSDGYDRAVSTVRVDADTLNANGNLLSFGAISPKSVKGGTASGQLQVNAGQTNVLTKDRDITFNSTSNTRVEGNVDVKTAQDATFAGGSTSFYNLESNRAFNLHGGNSVTATGNIKSVFADVNVNAGAGGIKLADVATGDAAYVNSLPLSQQNGAIKPGNISLATTKGGSIQTGNLSLDGTYNYATASPTTETSGINVVSAGNLSTGNVRARLDDRANHGSAGFTRAALVGKGDVTVNGDVEAKSIDANGPSRQTSSQVVLASGEGKSLKVGGNVTVDSLSGSNGVSSGVLNKDTTASASINGGNIDINDVTVSAIGGQNPYTRLNVQTNAGSAKVGNLRARSYGLGFGPATPTAPGTVTKATGNARSTVYIRTAGTQKGVSNPYPTDLFYKAGNPRAEANNAMTESRYSSSSVVAGDSARTLIVKR